MSHTTSIFVELATRVAVQVDPNMGTARAKQGALQRLAEPNAYDVVFPFIAFLLVIVVPTAAALWVIYKTVTEKTKEADER